MTSCSLRPANRARKPPMAWMPSCELPAIRMTVSEIVETLGVPPAGWAVIVESLMKDSFNFYTVRQTATLANNINQRGALQHLRYHPPPSHATVNWNCISLIIRVL